MSSHEIAIDQFLTYHRLPCYIGITNHPQRRVFGDHNVDPDADEFLIIHVGNSAVASAIERYFVNRRVDGGTRGPRGHWVYVYVHRPWTRR